VDSTQLKTILTGQNLVRENDTVIVGCSAGPDSTALLSLFCECDLGIKAIAVYVDHGLRPPQEIGKEVELVQNIAERLGIPHEIVAVDVKGHKRRTASSLEESARVLRYGALEQCRRRHNAQVIAVAHTADDQAEEVLLRLFRGTGLKGLSGMQPKNDTIIRPLLQISKNELLEYLNSTGIPYCTDSSNTDKSFLRNRLRLDLLPRIKEQFNPAIRSTLLQTAAILREDDDLLESMTIAELAECTRFSSAKNACRSASLDTGTFLQKHTAIRRRIIEKLCWKFGSRPQFHHIEKLIHLAESGRNGAELHLPQGLRIYKSRDRLTFQQQEHGKKFRGQIKPASIPHLRITAPAEYGVAVLNRKLKLESLQDPPPHLATGELLVDGGKVDFPLTLRPAEQGERFTPPGMNGRKKISRFLADLKIPRQQRFEFPVLASEDRVVAVVGLQIDDRFATDSTTTRFLKITWRPLEEKIDDPSTAGP